MISNGEHIFVSCLSIIDHMHAAPLCHYVLTRVLIHKILFTAETAFLTDFCKLKS